jgi:YidC/Oxa1 family membrane protein insertase
MKKLQALFPYFLIFFATFFLLQYIQGGSTPDPVLSSGDIGIQTAKHEYAIGKDIQAEIQNNTEETITLEYPCNEIPFEVLKYSSSGSEPVEKELEMNCEGTLSLTLEPGQEEKLSLLDHTYTLFGEIGLYKLQLTVGEEAYTTPEFTIEEPGFITKTWRWLIYQPILNALIATIIYMPGHHLGLAIILLTLLIRTLLLAPSQKAMKAQRRMQEMQPKIEELKKKYANDQARLSQETMMLWKEHKVNPLSSCTPMLIQFPILIALFYVIKGGLTPDRAALIYDFLPPFSLTDIDSMFLSFDLMDRSLIVLPLIIGGLQFMQMKLMYISKKKKDGDKKKKAEGMAAEMENATKMMKYVMPVMIAFFTAQLPAAVGLYWGTTTFYGIIQQLVVNNSSSPTTKSTDGDNIKVRVIKKSHGKKD